MSKAEAQDTQNTCLRSLYANNANAETLTLPYVLQVSAYATCISEALCSVSSIGVLTTAVVESMSKIQANDNHCCLAVANHTMSYRHSPPIMGHFPRF